MPFLRSKCCCVVQRCEGGGLDIELRPPDSYTDTNTHSVDLPTGTLPLLTAALASGCWPHLEELDIALDLLALDAFAGPALLGEGCVSCPDVLRLPSSIHTHVHIHDNVIAPARRSHITMRRSPRRLKSLTLRLLFRPDQEDVDASVNGEGFARVFKVREKGCDRGGRFVCVRGLVEDGSERWALPLVSTALTGRRLFPRCATNGQEGRLARLESLSLLPDEVKFGGEGDGGEGGGGGVEVADMVWVATDAFRCV